MEKNWYVIHTYSGYENKVKTALEERVKQFGKEEYFSEVVIPTENVVEIVKGVKKTIGTIIGTANNMADHHITAGNMVNSTRTRPI